MSSSSYLSSLCFSKTSNGFEKFTTQCFFARLTFVSSCRRLVLSGMLPSLGTLWTSTTTLHFSKALDITPINLNFRRSTIFPLFCSPLSSTICFRSNYLLHVVVRSSVLYILFLIYRNKNKIRTYIFF